MWKGLGQTAKASKPAAVIRPSRKGVIITIAREHGSAGKRIGQLVAQRLGIPCYYKELVAIAAQESGLAQEFISNTNSDENAVMRELYLTTDPIQRAIVAQERAIRHIAEAGACVLIGRSADYVLQNYPGVVRIFIHAPRNYREKKVMEMCGDTLEVARKSIARYEAAYQRQLSQYSLDCEDGIEYSACLHEPTPDEVLELKERFCRLWNALNSLPPAQGRRVDACIIPVQTLFGVKTVVSMARMHCFIKITI